jgi:hypothetical protein
VGKPEGKKPLGRPGSRWVDYIRMDLNIEWIDLAHDRDRLWALVNTVINLQVP